MGFNLVHEHGISFTLTFNDEIPLFAYPGLTICRQSHLANVYLVSRLRLCFCATLFASGFLCCG